MATCDVTALMEAAKCFMCLNAKHANIAMAQLLCEALTAAAPADPCSETYQDSFDGPDGQELLDPPWDHPGDTFLYDSGKAIQDPGGDDSSAYYAGFTFLDGYVQAECWGEGLHTLYLRLDYPNNEKYQLVIDMTGGGVELKRGSTVIASGTVTPVTGAVLRLEAVGTMFTAKYGGDIVFVVQDNAALAILEAGWAGIHGGEPHDAIFDNFECCSWDTPVT